MPDSTKAQRRIAEPEDYVATFATFKPGEKVLEDLSARFHDRRIYQAGGLEAARETERRAAQKEVMEFIFRMMGMTPESNDNEN